MNSFFKISFLVLFFPPIANSALIENNYKGNWIGIEVIGVDSITAQKIRAAMPIKEGGNFILTDIQKYKSECQEVIKKNIPNSEAHCSCVLLGDKKVFLVADVLPSSSGSKGDLFRTLPKRKWMKVQKLPEKLLNLYLTLEEKLSFYISQGKFPLEKINNGYLDYEDPILHKLALQLSKQVPKYNDVLLNIIRYSNNAEERRTAAILFSWARHPENIQLILKWNILFDPDVGVRNNIGRSYVFVMQDMKNESLLRKLIPVYCKQATLPSHTDRNKALTSLFEILKKNKEMVSTVNVECEATIRYISEVSILNNVGGIAKEIVKLLDSVESA